MNKFAWLLVPYIVAISTGPIGTVGINREPLYVVRMENGEIAGYYANEELAKDHAQCLNKAHAEREEDLYWKQIDKDPGREVTPPKMNYLIPVLPPDMNPATKKGETSDDFTGKKP